MQYFCLPDISSTAFLLQGMLKCAKCKHTVVIVNNHDIRYYICHANVRKTLYDMPCNVRFARTQIVDAAFWSALKQICASKKSITAYIKQAEKGKTKPKDETKKLKARLEQIDKEKAVVVGWFTDGLIKQDAATEKLSVLTNEAQRIEKALATPKAKAKAIDVEKIYNTMKNCGDSFTDKRNAVRTLIDYIEFERTDGKKKSLNYDLNFVIHFL